MTSKLLGSYSLSLVRSGLAVWSKNYRIGVSEVKEVLVISLLRSALFFSIAEWLVQVQCYKLLF